MKSWIRGKEYVITPEIVASALGVPLVQQPVYLYTKSPHLDDIMSLITGTSINWGTDPQVTSHELTEFKYLFLGFPVIVFGLFLMSILFLLRDVRSCTLSSLRRL